MKEINLGKKVLKGTVVSNKMEDTVIVAVKRFVKHSKYKKFYTKTKRYSAHAPKMNFELGDLVTIQECRPISKTKHFTVLK